MPHIVSQFQKNHIPILSVAYYSMRQPVEEIPLKSTRNYQNALVCRLLRLRQRVHEDDQAAYWELIDDILNLSIDTAIRLLQNLYDYRIRKLRPHESKRLYPQIANDVYRLEYEDEPGVFRDVCTGSLLKEALDLLKEEAERLIREVRSS